MSLSFTLLLPSESAILSGEWFRKTFFFHSQKASSRGHGALAASHYGLCLCFHRGYGGKTWYFFCFHEGTVGALKIKNPCPPTPRQEGFSVKCSHSFARKKTTVPSTTSLSENMHFMNTRQYDVHFCVFWRPGIKFWGWLHEGTAFFSLKKSVLIDWYTKNKFSNGDLPVDNYVFNMYSSKVRRRGDKKRRFTNRQLYF